MKICTCSQDGNAGWQAAGYEMYSGVHVPSKAFGEHVEHHDNTPRIAAAELKAKQDAGEDLVVLDSRPTRARPLAHGAIAVEWNRLKRQRG